ncbi:MAG: hypothetical protein Q9178_003369 [Gyalolechia marmorata]
MRSPGTHLVSTPATPSDGSTQRVDHGRRREEPDERQVNANPKRKREEDPETAYAVPAHSGDPKTDSRREYFAGHSQSIPRDDVRPLSGPKRVRINGLQPAQASPPRSQTRPTVLPPELWHHVFRFVPPVFLGRLLRVNHAFHSYLTSNAAERKPEETSSYTGVVRPLDAEAIWAASRKRFAPGLPKPLRNLKELDMWRLLRGQACQLCGQTKDPVPMTGDDIDLLLSSDFPSFLCLALPFALVSKSLNYIPNLLFRESTVPPSLELVKRYYKPHVQQIRQQLDDVRELGTASADEWGKGLPDERKERMNDALRWEQWEAKGGLKKVNMRPQLKVAAPLTVTAAIPTLPPKPPSIADIDALASQQVPIDPRYNGQHSDGFALTPELYHHPYGVPGMPLPPPLPKSKPLH